MAGICHANSTAVRSVRPSLCVPPLLHGHMAGETTAAARTEFGPVALTEPRRVRVTDAGHRGIHASWSTHRTTRIDRRQVLHTCPTPACISVLNITSMRAGPSKGVGSVSKIERAEVLVASPGRNFVTLRITTSDGVTGWATRR